MCNYLVNIPFKKFCPDNNKPNKNRIIQFGADSIFIKEDLWYSTTLHHVQRINMWTDQKENFSIFWNWKYFFLTSLLKQKVFLFDQFTCWFIKHTIIQINRCPTWNPSENPTLNLPRQQKRISSELTERKSIRNQPLYLPSSRPIWGVLRNVISLPPAV